ncbi:MAG: DegT/DnrJ/EryC1/StrS family aminotransferase [Verrucomicrobia bacterium]|nr:DegT/DnrJ/EryC1/StrS family aminotransferase [Verrucomicrobiota bacterium]MBV9644676.1 DegT/DnrJ/EryC1/StrS family aminotransferase [Verrucomicrobiota bacterium]
MQLKVPFLDLRSHNAPMLDEIKSAIGEVIDSASFAGGSFVASFEADFGAYCGNSYAIGVGSGTEALWLALLGLGVGPGDDVITVPNSFIATAEAITYSGARPVFVDVDERTYTMNPAALAEVLTARTKAIIPVHLFGQPADMDPILQFAREHGLFVVEDACQAHGAEYKARKVGTLGDAGCFSFYPGKNLGAFGEAGAVVTKNAELQEKIRTLRDHGQIRKYYHSVIGWNCRMDGIQAAVLRIKLRHLERGNRLRRSHAAHYDRALEGLEEIVTPVELPCVRHVYHIYAIRLADRDEVIRLLSEKGVGCGVHYPVPIHLQEAYRNLGYEPASFPVAERCATEFVSLPMFPELTPVQLELVGQAVKQAVTRCLVLK